MTRGRKQRVTGEEVNRLAFMVEDMAPGWILVRLQYDPPLYRATARRLDNRQNRIKSQRFTSPGLAVDDVISSAIRQTQ